MRYNEIHNATLRARIVAVIAGIALLMTACGSSTGMDGSSQAGGSTTYQKELAYTQCMRTHGVPNFPEPGSSGLFVNNGTLHLDSPQGQAAQKDCRHLLPAGIQPSGAQVQQINQQLLKFSHCMRSHGVLNFPDPTNGGIHLGGENGNNGFNTRSPQFQSARQACQYLIHAPAGATP